MATIPWIEKFQVLTETPKEIRDLLENLKPRQTATRSLLSLLIENPSGINIGTTLEGSSAINLAKPLEWEGGTRSSINWQELKTALTGVRYHLRQNMLRFKVSCSCPDWTGSRYRTGTTKVVIAFVDPEKLREEKVS